MFKQITTWYTSGTAEINGVLNFRTDDISYFHTSRGSEFATLLLKGSQIYYTVKYDDLKQLIEAR
jgi:hypothetical protein